MWNRSRPLHLSLHTPYSRDTHSSSSHHTRCTNLPGLGAGLCWPSRWECCTQVSWRGARWHTNHCCSFLTNIYPLPALRHTSVTTPKPKAEHGVLFSLSRAGTTKHAEAHTAGRNPKTGTVWAWAGARLTDSRTESICASHRGEVLESLARHSLQLVVQTYAAPAVPDCLVPQLWDLAANPFPFLSSCHQRK